MKRPLFFICVTCLALWQSCEVFAGEYLVNKKISPAEDVFYADAVSLALEAGGLFSTNSHDTTWIPASMVVGWQLDEVGNDGWKRGNTQFNFEFKGAAIEKGVEKKFLGFMAGPQYNFVQHGWKWVPFVGARVGVGFVESQSEAVDARALAQDFNFTFSVNAGVRYLITNHWHAAIMVENQHISNGGLSEPQRANRAVDILGAKFL